MSEFVLTTTSTLYAGTSGKPQEVFFGKAGRGWEDLQKKTLRHISNGITQFEYLKELSDATDGQAQRLLEENAFKLFIMTNDRADRTSQN